MVLSSFRLDIPGPRDWPTLRDLLVRAAGTGQCDELAAAVAGAERPAEAWRERMAGMCGSGRFTLFVRDAQDVVQGLVSAYLDGDRDARYVIVRHLLILAEPADYAAITHPVLDRVESWSALQGAGELLLEVDADAFETSQVLLTRGYEQTGTMRPAFHAVADSAHTHGEFVSEWRRRIRSPRCSPRPAAYAVAS